jgi:hypothetical protein
VGWIQPRLSLHSCWMLLPHPPGEPASFASPASPCAIILGFHHTSPCILIANMLGATCIANSPKSKDLALRCALKLLDCLGPVRQSQHLHNPRGTLWKEKPHHRPICCGQEVPGFIWVSQTFNHLGAWLSIREVIYFAATF